MFYKKTITKDFKEALQNQQKYFETLLDNTYKQIEQLEKRINNIADYIAGPYTKTINNEFEKIQKEIENIYINLKKTNKREKKWKK